MKIKTAQLGTVLCLLLHIACVRSREFEDRHTEPVPESLAEESVSTATFPSTWNTAQSSGGPGFQVFKCEFLVPTAPKYEGQSIYLWCGVQQSSGVTEKKDFGVLQPVLMFGPDCIQDLPEGQRFGPDNDSTYERSPYWYYSAQYIYPDPSSPGGYKCTTGPVFMARPGEILVSSMAYDARVDVMTVRISTSSGSRVSSLTVRHPKDNQSLRWKSFLGRREILLEGALEIPNPDPKHPMPPEIFTGWKLKAQVTSLPQFPLAGTGAWQLKANQDNTLSVRCAHHRSNLGSDCTWSR
jgi:hypothetical protein